MVVEKPFVLSEEVQAFAISYDFPATITDERASVALQEYLDLLTAVQVAANARSQARGRLKPTTKDFKLAASLWCKFPLPFKPPDVSAFRATICGAYLSPTKRSLITRALGRLFLEATSSEIFALDQMSMEDFENNFISFSLLEAHADEVVCVNG